MSSRPKPAVDTSVAVAALDPNHEAHTEARRVVSAARCALSGHAAFETYSVLTRLPVPLRLGSVEARGALDTLFPLRCWLTSDGTQALAGEIGSLGIVGGAVFDALVGAAARENRFRLLTRDRRAERTYIALGVDYEFVA